MFHIKLKKIYSKVDDYGAVLNSIITLDKRELIGKQQNLPLTLKKIDLAREGQFVPLIQTLSVKYRYHYIIDLFIIKIQFAFDGHKWHKK